MMPDFGRSETRVNAHKQDGQSVRDIIGKLGRNGGQPGFTDDGESCNLPLSVLGYLTGTPTG